MAIDIYSAFESELMDLMQCLLGIDYRTANIVFWRIANTRSRIAILKDAFSPDIKGKVKTFWKGMQSQISKLDSRRNKIVHWQMTVHLCEEGVDYVLKRQAKMDILEMITINDLIAFIIETNFTVSVLRHFVKYLLDLKNGRSDLPIPWQGIFQQPFAYPPPKSHPLSPIPKARQFQPAPHHPIPPELLAEMMRYGGKTG
jgi:hypothetical protein